MFSIARCDVSTRRVTPALSLAFAALALVAHAAESAAESESSGDATESVRVETVEVRGRADQLVGFADTATEGHVGARELLERPLLRPGEVLEAVPGVIITQHSGGGKANQYFLRGFNLDHGTDFRTTVDGIPVNMPTHAHGQGYTDLNFLIPELVAFEEYRKGPYDARVGDFGAAGSVDVELVEALDRPLVSAAGGAGYGRLLAAASRRFDAGTLLSAFESTRNDGPWIHPDDYRRTNGLLRWTAERGEERYTVTAMGYDGQWNATDQVPLRAVRDGRLDRFDTIDPTSGGSTHRYSLSTTWRRAQDAGSLQVRAYALHYALQLFSNFTYFLDDPDNGDQFEQNDRRVVAGGEIARSWAGTYGTSRRGWQLETGLQVRRDGITNGLFHTRSRQRLSTTRRDAVTQWGIAPYAQAHVVLGGKVRAVVGARADLYRAQVDSDDPRNTGRARASRLSPKAGLAVGPWRQTEFYASYGDGFHSSDARGATIRVIPGTADPADRVTPLVRVRGTELGARTQALHGLQSTLALFRLDIDSELLFVGDAGVTEAGRPSRRTGVEWANFYQPFEHVAFDLDVSASRARFTDPDPAGARIPGSVEHVVSAGVTVSGWRRTFGAMRLRYFGPRALIEDDSRRSKSSTLLYATVGFALGRGLRVSLDGFNLLDEKVSDIDYFYASRLPGESEPVEDVHFHPAESRTVRLVLEWRP